MIHSSYCGFIHRHLQENQRDGFILRANVDAIHPEPRVRILIIGRWPDPAARGNAIGWIKYEAFDPTQLRMQIGIDSIIEDRCFTGLEIEDSQPAYELLFRGRGKPSWFDLVPSWKEPTLHFATLSCHTAGEPLPLEDALLHTHLGALKSQLATRYIHSNKQDKRKFYEAMFEGLQNAMAAMREGGAQ